MIIRFTIIVVLTVSSLSFAFGQDKPIDDRLLTKFSLEELNQMQPVELDYWSKVLEFSLEIIELPEQKLSDIEEFVSIESITPENLNLFELHIEPHEFVRTYRRIEGSGLVLVIRPWSEINQYAKQASVEPKKEISSVQTRGGGALTIPITSTDSITIPCGDEHFFQDNDPTNSYDPNSNDTITICSDGINGGTVTLDLFIASGGTWDIDGSDTLYVYDGTDVNAPLIGAYNSDTDTDGISVQSTFDNPSGCLTVVFISDGANEGDGFAGLTTCAFPCQPIQPFIASDPLIEPADTGYIDICLGDTVWLSGNGQFPFSAANGGSGYNQTVQNSTFDWEFADGTVIEDSDSVAFVPQIIAGYFVEMRVTDTLGCIEATTTKIRVGTVPNFASTTSLLEDTICFGESALLLGGVTFQDTAGVDATQGAFINGGIFAGLTYLPDGSGVNYETDIEITQFDPGQIVEDPSDIIDICVTMEHSWLGDLEMMLTCPNGTEIVMFNSYTQTGIGPAFAGGFGGGGTFLGDPVDNTSGQPGIGWEYCFSESAVWGTMGDEHPGNTQPTTIEGGPSMSPGTYQPEQTYADLIGCPINGTWTLTIRDNIGADDGYIFEWGVLFNPDIDPTAEFYFPSIDTAFWSPDPTIANVFGDTAIEVLPPTPGNWQYTFNIEDNFGCTYDTTIVVHMVPELTEISFIDTAICAQEINLIAADFEIEGEWSYTAIQSGVATFSPNNLSYDAAVEIDEYGEYEFVFQSDYCDETDTVVVDFNPVPSAPILDDQTICPETEISFDAENFGILAEYSWLPTGDTSQILTLDSLTETTGIQVTVTNACGTANGAATITVENLEVSGPSDVCLEASANLIADLTTSGGSWSYVSPNDADVSFSPSESESEPDVTASAEGLHRFIFTDDDCGMKDSVEVFFTPSPTVTLTVDTNRICVEDEVTISFSTNTELYDDFSWGPFGTSEDTLVISGTDSSTYNTLDTTFQVTASVNNYCGVGADTVVYQVIDCVLELPTVFNPSSLQPENSVFNIVALELHPGNNVKIYDRWGRKVYEADDYHLNPWDGDGQSDGVYYYVLERTGYDPEGGYVHLVGGGQ